MGFFSFLFSRSSSDQLGREEKRVLRRGSEDDLVQYARRLVDENELERAAEILRRAEERFPGAEAVANLKESVDESLTHAQIGALQAQLAEHSTPELLVRMAELYRRLSDMPQAMKYGRDAIEHDPESAIGYRVVGKLYLEQFRVARTSVHGINALRYLSKAHALDPRDSRVLLHLAEIFVVLRAPTAARKFLSPVLGAFPNDPVVIRLEERTRELPDEGSSQIQDLFLRHDQRVSGEQPQRAVEVDLPPETEEQLQELGASIDGTLAVLLLDVDRNVLCSYCSESWSLDDVGESLGLLGDTARQNSQRMGIGTFSRIVVRAPDNFVMVETMGDEVTGYYVGKSGVKQDEVEALLSRVAETLGVQTAQEVSK